MPDCRMMLRSVPIFTSLWFGTGTVVVAPASVRCMMRWLLRCRTSANPCRARIPQTSAPESTRSLPNGDLDLGHEHVARPASLNFFGARAFEEKFEGFLEVAFRFFDALALAGDVEFRAMRDETSSFGRDDRRQPPAHQLPLPQSLYPIAASDSLSVTFPLLHRPLHYFASSTTVVLPSGTSFSSCTEPSGQRILTESGFLAPKPMVTGSSHCDR
jgi:hypothetical protein